MSRNCIWAQKWHRQNSDPSLLLPLLYRHSDYMQWMYYVGFRNVNASNATALGLAKGTTLEKLQEFAEAGFSREDVDAALFTVEMGRKQTMATEKDTGVNLLRWVSSLPFPSLPFPSLPFPSLPFPSLPFASLPSPPLPSPTLPSLPSSPRIFPSVFAVAQLLVVARSHCTLLRIRAAWLCASSGSLPTHGSTSAMYLTSLSGTSSLTSSAGALTPGRRSSRGSSGPTCWRTPTGSTLCSGPRKASRQRKRRRWRRRCTVCLLPSLRPPNLTALCCTPLSHSILCYATPHPLCSSMSSTLDQSILNPPSPLPSSSLNVYPSPSPSFPPLRTACPFLSICGVMDGAAEMHEVFLVCGKLLARCIEIWRWR